VVTFRLIVLLLVSVLSAPSFAIKDVKLITIGYGDEFWSAFGHTALAIDDTVYGFGYFSFEDEGLIQSFVTNQMQYDLGVSDFSREVELAHWQNRTFIVQKLALSESEKLDIIQYLTWHNLPENQSYHYDYFLNNCSTKIRDIIDDAWGGLLQAEYSQSSNNTYFNQTFPAKNQSLMNLGLALAYGWPAYSVRSDWELMAFPLYLQQKITEMAHLKATSPTVLYREVPKSALMSLVQTHWVMVLIFLVVLVLLLVSKTRRATQKTLLIVQSVIGLILLSFWLFSGHQVLAWNFNVLLFSPIAFLLFKYHQLKWFLLLSYMAWSLFAVFLGAWYLIPIWVLHMLSIRSYHPQKLMSV